MSALDLTPAGLAQEPSRRPLQGVLITDHAGLRYVAQYTYDCHPEAITLYHHVCHYHASARMDGLHGIPLHYGDNGSGWVRADTGEAIECRQIGHKTGLLR